MLISGMTIIALVAEEDQPRTAEKKDQKAGIVVEKLEEAMAKKPRLCCVAVI